jgi:2-oxoglutarate dehydrogenase E1 component
MGYWYYVRILYPGLNLVVNARKSSSSPATGYAKVHAKEQAEIVKKAFTV